MKLALHSALSLGLLAGPGLAQQPPQGVIDILDSVNAVGVDSASAGGRVVVGGRNRLDRPPWLDVFEAPVGSVDFVPVARLAPAEWLPTWYVWEAAVDGDVVAHQVDKRFDTDTALYVHERTPSGWTATSVDLPGPKWLILGHLTAVSGDRIVTLASPGLHRLTRLHVIERTQAGGWALVDSVVTDVRAPWFEYPMEVVLDGDVAALSGPQGATSGDVAVCEPDATGAWVQSATLSSPGDGNWTTEALALENGVLAVVRVSVGPTTTRRYMLHLYRRAPSGTWAISGRTELPTPVAVFPSWGVELDGPRIAVSEFDRLTVYVQGPSGDILPEHGVDRVYEVAGFDAGRLVAHGDYGVRVIDLPQAPGFTTGAWLRGQETCPGTGVARLRVHDQHVNATARRSAAEITDAPPGATAFVLRSADPNSLPALGGLLCVDRLSAGLAAPLRTIDGAGTATFDLMSNPAVWLEGFEAADHLQAVILVSTPVLTNALAWLP